MRTEMYMEFMHNIFVSIGCGLFGVSCVAATSTAPLHGVVVSAAASSTPGATVVTTDINGKTKTQTIDAPYGVETRVMSTTKNGTTTSVASTTALSRVQATRMETQTEAQIRAMQQQIQEQEQQMQQMFAEQQKLFQQMQAGF